MALVTLYANNPSTTVTGSSGTTAPAALATETWTVASSAAFPAAATGVSQFHIADPALAAEIIAVTNVSGTTWSVTRGVESTTPVAHATGATYYQVVSAGDLTGLAQSTALGTGATANIDLTTGDIAASPGTAAAGASGALADAKHVHPQPPMFAPSGMAGATAASRYVGATSSGSPTGNPFLVGDHVVDQTGAMWICITSGTPGTWTRLGHINVTAGNIAALGAQAAGAVGTAADAGHVHPTSGLVTGVTAGDTSVVMGGTLGAPTVATGTLDVIATQHPPAANWSNNSHKITSVANGSSAQDAAAFGQIPAALPPNGSAGGVLSGTYPNPGLAAPFVLTPVTLTDAASVTVNAAAGNNFKVTLGGNRTLANPSSPTDGQVITVEVIQDGTGSRTLAYGTAYTFPASIGTPVLSTTAGNRDFLAFQYNTDDTTWWCTGFVPQQAASSALAVSLGGTGNSSLTTYALLAGGTTSTGALQQVSGLGTTGTALISNGATALPTWQDYTDNTAGDIAPIGATAVAGSVGLAADAGHVHVDSQPIPADFGWVAWTADLSTVGAGVTAAPSTSTIYLIKIFLRQAATMTGCWYHVVTSSATLNSGQNFIGIYDSSGNRQAVTADQTSSWGSTGVKQVAFASPYSAPAGQYYIAINMSVASATGPALRGTGVGASSTIANAGLTGAGLRFATQAGQTSLPSTLTYSSNVQTLAGNPYLIIY